MLATSLIAYFIVSLGSCGPADLLNRILGGTETTIEEFPFQLALEGGGRQLCGGSVLSEVWVLTAAHCVYDQPAKWLVFRAGSDKLLNGGTLHPVKYYVTHDQYTKYLTYDVAVVKVTKPFVFTKKLLPVILPDKVPEKGENTWVAGWGFTEKEQLKKPKQLMMADIYVIGWEDCKNLYGNYFTPSMLCAGFYDKDTCSGDSGGPLIRAGREQVGIVSWGYKCGDGLPSVYTNVSAVIPWILKITRLGLDDGPFMFPLQ